MTGWQDHPFGISVKKGETVAFCMCNNSKNGPYCDGLTREQEQPLKS